MNAFKNPYAPGSLRYVALLSALVWLASTAPVAAKTSSPAGEAMLVDCKLPPQIRTLGRNMTYLAAGRQIQTSVSECQVRGGTYDGRGPGALAGNAASADPNGRIPVTVGGDAGRAGCPGAGVVARLQAAGTLSVRSSPRTSAERLDKLSNGASVFLCDWTADGAWVGIVYAGDSGARCGVDKPIGRAQPYAGACRSGWVSLKYVRAGD